VADWLLLFIDMHVPGLIEKKRDGGKLTAEEIEELIEGFTHDKIPDYQMSAWAMAVFFRGMTAVETKHLTDAMMNSGRVLKYPKDSPPKIDKHSTGGVGDKVSLVLAPLLACDEVWVPMISGRGLGITGGTLDKLESIPGFNVNLDEKRAIKQLDKIGVFMIGQTADICPADKKLYALRDVTGTVPSQALIVASIMSKKLAENLDRLVLDVKFGSGAFMKTRAEAKELADAMTEVGEGMGVKMSHLLSPMEEPLGRAVGNALEVAECVEILQGGGPDDLVKLIIDLAEKVSTTSRSKLKGRLKDGSAWKKFVSLVYAQDGDATTLENILKEHRAPVIHPIAAKKSGTVKKMDAESIGRASVLLGGGRQKAGDEIDFAVGISAIKKIGEHVDLGEPLMKVHARNNGALEAVLPLLQKAVAIG
jgi:pyrimidine-nucleoside phosphorylase